MKPVGVPGAFAAVVDPEPVVGFVDAVGAPVGPALVVGGAVAGAVLFGVVATLVGLLDVAPSALPVTPALRGDDEL